MTPVRSDSLRTLTFDSSLRRSLGRLARGFVPEHADFCGIYVIDGDALTCAAHAHVTPAGNRLMQRLDRAYPIALNDRASTSALVARTGQPLVRTNIQLEPAPMSAGRTVEVFELHQRLAPRSALVVPIMSGTTVLGSLTLCYAGSGRGYSGEDVSKGTTLAARIGRAIEEASLTHAARRDAVLDRQARPVLMRMRECIARLRAGAPRDERMRLLGEVARQERLLRRLLTPSSPLFAAVSSASSRRSRTRARV